MFLPTSGEQVKSLKLTLLTFLIAGVCQAFPGAPKEASHPGSKVYTYGVQEKNFKCLGRDVVVHVPTSQNPSEMFPAVIYGHGQALGIRNYKATLEQYRTVNVFLFYLP